jgi:hypothetical protein
MNASEACCSSSSPVQNAQYRHRRRLSDARSFAHVLCPASSTAVNFPPAAAPPRSHINASERRGKRNLARSVNGEARAGVAVGQH